jgi:hypothetical protein
MPIEVDEDTGWTQEDEEIWQEWCSGRCMTVEEIDDLRWWEATQEQAWAELNRSYRAERRYWDRGSGWRR